MKGTLFVDITFIDIDRNDLCEEHVMCAEREHLRHLTLDGDRCLLDGRRSDDTRLTFMQIHFFPLIDLVEASDTTIIECAHELLTRKVDDELAALYQHRIARPAFPHRNIRHRRIRADRTCPRNRDDVRFSCLIPEAHHHRRYRIYEITWFLKCDFAHKTPAVDLLCSSSAHLR